MVFTHGAKYQDEADEETHKIMLDIDGPNSHRASAEFSPYAVPRVTATIEAGELGEGNGGHHSSALPTVQRMHARARAYSRSPSLRPLLRFCPGSVIALVGEGSSGKTTLLRLLARQHIPSSGWISYPEYWRVRYLDAIDPPYFFKGTMKENLKFGNQHEHTDKEVRPKPPHPRTFSCA